MSPRRLAKNFEKQLRRARLFATAPLREFAVIRTALHLPRNDFFPLATSQPDHVTVHPVDPAENFSRPLPFAPGETSPPPSFLKEQTGTVPATFVAELGDGRFWGYYGGSVMLSDGRLITELSKDVWGPRLHSAQIRAAFPRPRRLAGRTLSLVTPEAAANYHHWNFDLLTRAGLARRAGFDLAAFDHVLIKHHNLPYQIESLTRLGLDPARVRLVQPEDHFECDTLVVPAIRDDNTRVNRADLEFLRRLYLSEEPSPAASRRRLYISRNDAKFRRVANEPEILPLLKQHGFEQISMSGRSVADQARLFSEAAIIVAPNGAALSNLAFANTRCRLIELFAPSWIVPYMWMITAHLGIRHTALIGRGPRLVPGVLPHGIRDDITIDPVLLQQAIEQNLA